MGRSLGVNSVHVVHETIDGETILIHLGTGTYYNLEGAGAEVWNLLAAGTDEARLLEAAYERYDGDPEPIAEALSTLVDELVGEGLLVEADAAVASEAQRLPAGRVPFTPPVLGVYTDMQEFMLVDPVHQVDEGAGWPHVKPA
ncbi:MAG TPA: PqqD family protein [Solirubrobacteraceae bacterium]|jgi:hypothetical protein|nr:PqqD family protein [Solirubrobacteraceae bacterium]